MVSTAADLFNFSRYDPWPDRPQLALDAAHSERVCRFLHYCAAPRCVPLGWPHYRDCSAVAHVLVLGRACVRKYDKRERGVGAWSGGPRAVSFFLPVCRTTPTISR